MMEPGQDPLLHRPAQGGAVRPAAGNRVPAGRLLVCDASTAYGFGRTQYARHGSHVGLGQTRYRLFAADRRVQDVNTPTEKPAAQPAGGKQKRRARAPEKSTVQFHWSREVPLLVRAMVLADETLFVAGPANTLDPNDSPGVLEGRRGALLWVVSAKDGKKLAEHGLDASPVFDGMAAANGRLYLSTTDGKVSCLAGK